MGEAMTQVVQTLQQSLHPDPTVRKEAEARIAEFEKHPGFAILLLELVCNESTAADIRMGAAVTFKNLVKKNWGPTPEVDLPAEEEAQIRSAIVDAMFANKGNLQNQLSHALHLIAQRDFPERWPEIVPSLAQHLATDNLDRILAALSALEQLFRKFRYEGKSLELWTELKSCLTTVQEPMTKLYAKMVEMKAQKDSLAPDLVSQWLEVLYLCVRNFHSLSYQDLPEYFEDNLSTWVKGFLELMDLVCQSQISAAGEPTFQDKLKAEMLDVCTLYAQRYEEEFSSFMQPVIEAVWKLVVSSGPDVRYDGMVCAALEFLSIISQKMQYAEIFTQEGVLQLIAKDVCVKNLTLRQEDMELFEDEPIDFMKRDLEGTDVGTRRRGAIDLVRALCRRFEDKLFPILTEIIQTLCAGDWTSLDVVYSLVTAIASKSETAKSGATSTSHLIDVSDYYQNQVRAHLASDVNENPILKSDALKFVVIFRNQLKPEILVEVVQACDRLLSSSLPILHKYAAYSLDKLLLVKQNGSNELLLTARTVPVASLLNNLVSGFDKDPKAQHTPYLIKAILRIIAILDDETARHAGSIASRLASLVEAATQNPADSVHTHFLFEAMCVLIQKTAKLPDGGLDSQLMPLVEVIISKDLQDLVPYALQITGVLLTASVARGNIGNNYVSFVPFLLDPNLWSRSANVPAALSVLEVYLRHCPQSVLSQHSETVMKHFTRLIGSKSLDQYGFQLAIALLPVLEKIQVAESPKIILNNMFQRLQNSKTPKFVKQFIVFLGRFVIVRGAEGLVKAMGLIQANVFRMVIEKIVIAELNGNLKNLTTASDKRIITIGFANLLGQAPSYLDGLYGPLATGLTELVESVSASDRGTLSPEEEQASMYNAEGEFTNPYCRLSYAPKPDPVAPQITNYKAHLAQAVLQAGPATNPALLNCLSDQLRQHLTTYLSQ